MKKLLAAMFVALLMVGCGEKPGGDSPESSKKDGLQTDYYENGQKKREGSWKDGKQDGLWTGWYSTGQKDSEHTFKGGKLMTAVVWKPYGEKCPVTNVKDDNGVVVDYNDDGTEKRRHTYKDGEIVKD